MIRIASILLTLALLSGSSFASVKSFVKDPGLVSRALTGARKVGDAAPKVGHAVLGRTGTVLGYVIKVPVRVLLK